MVVELGLSPPVGVGCHRARGQETVAFCLGAVALGHAAATALNSGAVQVAQTQAEEEAS